MTDFTSTLFARASRKTSNGVMRYVDLYRQRRALKSLDDTRLADLGLSRQEAEKEANRPIWDAPNHWIT